MKDELELKLVKKYPKIFAGVDKPITESLMAFGFDCGNGWYWLIDALCNSIQSYIDNNKKPQVEALQVKEKYGCYDKETEVLTKGGWKYFKDVAITDEICTLKDGEFLEYCKPLDIIKYEYKGKMYHIKTQQVDLLVTPNHNLYVAKGSYYNGRYSPPKKRNYTFELVNYGKYLDENKCFKKGAIWNGEYRKTFELPEYKYTNWMKLRNKYRTYTKHEKSFIMENWLKFLGWYVAEGCSWGNTVSIAFNPYNDEKNIIAKIIENIGLKYKIEKSVIRIYSIQLAKWLLKNCGHLAPNKRVPNFIKNLDKNQIIIFLNSVFQGDGHKSKTAQIYYTVSPKLSNDIQELILKAGFTFSYDVCPPRKSTNRIQGKYPCYAISWLRRSNYHNTQNKGLSKSSFERLEDYNDYVYCVTVPNNIIYVRRIGLPVWCGNSLRFYISGGDDIVDGMIWFAESISYHICETCGTTKRVTTTDDGWVRTLCPKCRKDRNK